MPINLVEGVIMNPHNLKELKGIAKASETPEDYGYLALFVSITCKVTPDKAIILMKGQRKRRK
jgi:hypothetical protein